MNEVDVFLKDEGNFVTIGFQTEKAKKALAKDAVLNRLQYSFGDGSLPKVDFPMRGIKSVKFFLNANDLTFEEC
jgi:hypothetical protein